MKEGADCTFKLGKKTKLLTQAACFGARPKYKCSVCGVPAPPPQYSCMAELAETTSMLLHMPLGLSLVASHTVKRTCELDPHVPIVAGPAFSKMADTFIHPLVANLSCSLAEFQGNTATGAHCRTSPRTRSSEDLCGACGLSTPRPGTRPPSCPSPHTGA